MKKLALCTLICWSLGAFASPLSAQTCIGNCGTASPNGDVTAPPAYGPNYGYVSTSGGVAGAGQITSAGGSNGSEYLTMAFSANAGDALNFYFNFITSDGAGFSDYGFAQLLNASLDPVAYLFTARTTTSGNTSPGFDLPANSATLTPSGTPIIGGAPIWAQLGDSSGGCFDAGCGYTDWINSNYVIETSGVYTLRLGVTNISDDLFDTGMAFAGITIAGVEVPIPGVPEPSTWLMLILGFGALGAAMRRAPKVRIGVVFG